jgi:hypothetical protein
MLEAGEAVGDGCGSACLSSFFCPSCGGFVIASLRHRRFVNGTWLDAFGALIANTDRHQHNILFFTEGSHLRLAPAFDQVSTLYVPTLMAKCHLASLCCRM